jgi:hypothetical protein
MRQAQQNRRGRGRGGRKPQNPLARSYESNGPDVKIRGTAAHIAEKYMSLARDALASGDLISAESYFQHAEHYNRIIMAAQQQYGTQHGAQQGEGPNGGYRQPRWSADGADDDGSEFDSGPSMGGADDARGFGQEQPQPQSQPQRRSGNGGDHSSREGNGSDAGETAPSEEPADPVS